MCYVYNVNTIYYPYIIIYIYIYDICCTVYCTFCEVYGIETHAVNKTSSLGIPNEVPIQKV